ncbi:MAG: glycine cleavage system aminomethyltransferase GcvT [Acidimicrobiia bacterium]
MSFRSPLHDIHETLGARFVDFGGWSMPVQYESVLAEHNAVRTGVGVFDVSHLGRAAVTGDGAEAALRRRLCNDVSELEPGRTQYTMILNPFGGVIDDLMVWRWPDRVWIMPNGGNHLRVLDEIREAGDRVVVEDLRPTTASIAVQGPNAPRLLEMILGVGVRRGHLVEADFAGASVRIGGTGYTGERGAEIVGEPEVVAAVLRALLDAGATPCGLGSRDTLRLEAGLPLWGQDLTEAVTPIQAGLGFAVAWDHEFVGRDALLAERDSPVRSLVAFTTGTRQIPRTGNALRADGATGWVTSGNFSPALGTGIGMGYIEPPTDAPIEVEIRGTWHLLQRVNPPFHR